MTGVFVKKRLDWPNEPCREYLYRCFNYQLNPQEIKKRRIIFKLFDSITAENSNNHNVLYDTITVKDLGLFAGQKNNEPYIAEIVDRTKTELGKVFLYGLIGNPIHDINLLQRRQSIIKYLVEHPNFLSKIDIPLDQCSASENMVLSLWAQDGFLNSTRRRYFSLPYMTNINEQCNRSQLLLELKA